MYACHLVHLIEADSQTIASVLAVPKLSLTSYLVLAKPCLLTIVKRVLSRRHYGWEYRIKREQKNCGEKRSDNAKRPMSERHITLIENRENAKKQILVSFFGG